MQLVKTTPTEAMQLGQTFFQSGLFSDLKSAHQAVVKIMAGAEMGISPFAAMSGIHIIQGKPTIGAGLMAARVKGFGKYDYKVVEHSEKICSIDFFKDKEKLGNSTFTIEDAKKAGTKNLDKFPKNMLFARAISNGVKWFTPDIYETPVYVPEEMDNITIDIPNEEPAKPKILVSETAFKQLLNRIAGGEDLKEKLTSLALTEYQSQMIDKLYEYVNQNLTKDEIIAKLEQETKEG